jgi:succinate-semialdehyde dehydrogenase / glutarate-semialdehyde dehydrogenase
MDVRTSSTPVGSSSAGIPIARCLIDGAWVEGEGASKDTVSPRDGAVVSRVRYATATQIDATVAAARRAQRKWAKVPMAARAEILSAGLHAVERNAESICRWISREMGKTINEARGEVVRDVVLPIGRKIIGDARGFAGRVPPAWSTAYPHRRVQVLNQPIGVTALISPWNFPVEKIVVAVASMMMGNACVWKPSEWAPFAPQLVTEVFLSAGGMPDGLLNLVYGGPEEGEHLVSHADVDLVSFIGSTAVGERITKAAGVKRLLLELGGNGPMIVLDDADIDRAVKAAVFGCFWQAGQVCTCAERILVHNAVYDEFAEKLAAAAKQLKVGDPLDETTEMGPLSETRILNKVVRHVEDARAKGATILTGGGHEGLFFQPTVLTNVTTDMEIYYEETFGPVAPLLKIKSADEALQLANSSQYGLSMAVFTSSMKTAFKMAEDLEAGMVNVNASNSDAEVNGPFGGWKKSGIGRLLGEDMLRCLSNLKTVTFDLG